MSLKGLPLFETGKPPTPQTWSVTELTARIKGVIEPAFPQVWVQGEVSNFRPAASGHVYFSLKDEGANIGAAIFGWGRKTPGGAGGVDLKDGMQVLCRGKVSLYPARGTYQLIVDQVQPLGAGALQLAFEKLKAKLAAEGLFDPKRKRKLPLYPKRIAIVTSPSGAAIRDILNILARRAPHVRVTIIPAVVQGDGAAEQIMRGIELAERHALGEVVVLARGGGSIEDLWCFNDERLARVIAACKLPVVSAVGHEIDFTISDFVSDLRAPTPSAAAEIITSVWVDVPAQVQEAMKRLVYTVRKDLAQKKTLLQHIAARLVSPKDKLREQSQRCDEWALRMEQALKNFLQRRRASLDQVMGRLDALSPLKVLERGYSIVRDELGEKVIRSAAQVESGNKLKIRFHDGEKTVEAT